MGRIVTVLAALLVGAAWSSALAQEGGKEGPALMGSNAEGFHFMVGFMQNEIQDQLYDCPWQPAYQSISISSRFTTGVRIIEPNGRVTDTSVVAFTVLELRMSPDYECIGEGVFPLGIEVIAQRPITVSCYSSKSQTSDGYLALPISAWGTEYVSANYFVDHYTPLNERDYCAVIPRAGELAVIAAHDATTVTVYPTTATVGGVGAFQPYRRVLRKGEIFQVQDGGDVRRSDWALGTDLTGSVVSADKPVGLLSGHMRTGVTTAYNSKDHLIEMLPPRSALGRRYFTVPFAGRLGGDLLRVISTTGVPTRVTIRSLSQGEYSNTMAGVGTFLEYNMIDPVEVVADQPVLVAQYARSAGADPRNADTLRVDFDPDMVVLTPTEQFVNGAIFATLPNINSYLNSRQFRNHFVTIIGERNGFDAIRLNGLPLVGMPTVLRGDMPGGNYVWATIEIAEKSTHVLSGDALFAGYLYGLGRFDSYAWPIGSGLRMVNPADADPPVITSSPLCGGVEVIVLDSGMTQNGLRSVWLDTTVSANARFEHPPITLGDEMFIGTVRPFDARRPAFARIWAEDRTGRLASHDVTISPSAPSFSSDSISLGFVQLGQTYTRPFTVMNNGAGSVVIDSIYLVSGREFLLERKYRNIALAADGGQLTLNIIFLTRARVSRFDTLVLVIDCREYRIPLSAWASAPQITTNRWDFGRVRVGRTGGPGQIFVVNTGDADLVITGATLAGATFSKTSELRWPVTLAPGEDTLAMEVFFQPVATRAFEGTVSFTSNVPDSVAVAPLTGVGIYPTLAIGGHNFGRVQLGDSACTTIPIANIGTDTTFLTGLDLPTPESFTYDRSAFPHALAQGDTLWVRVCFSPTEERDYLSDVSPRNDDDLTAMNTLRGVGYRLRATIGGKDMGRWWIGQQTDSIVYVTNVGTDPITITKVWIEGGDVGDFVVVDPLEGPRTLPPGGRLPVTVRFSPLQPGHREAFIHAETGSRHQPQLDSVLIGFGLFALSSDVLEFDDRVAYSCEQRPGRIVITNEGNTPLTLATLRFESTPAIMTLNAPAAGHTIPVGESLVLDFSLDFAGYVGVTRASVTWSFLEPPGPAGNREFTRELSIESRPQTYVITATSPGQVVPGETFDVTVRIDSAARPAVAESAVAVVVDFDPAMTLFDEPTWRAGAGDGPWRRGESKLLGPGRVELQYVTATGAPLPLAGVTLPAIPFKAFIGEHERDSFRVSLVAVGNACALPALAGAPVGIDSICGLSVRLFEFTGEPFLLRQNRPNPVRDRTEIIFTLAMEGSTRLELFAPDGRLVRVLVDAVLPAGDYTVPLDVSSMPSGQYYYRLTSGPFSGIRQMQIAQ